MFSSLQILHQELHDHCGKPLPLFTLCGIHHLFLPKLVLVILISSSSSISSFVKLPSSFCERPTSSLKLNEIHELNWLHQHLVHGLLANNCRSEKKHVPSRCIIASHKFLESYFFCRTHTSPSKLKEQDCESLLLGTATRTKELHTVDGPAYPHVLLHSSPSDTERFNWLHLLGLTHTLLK